MARNINCTELLYPATFRKWLEAHQPGECVGLTTSSRSCPLASYIREQIENQGVVQVGYREILITYSDDAESFPLPEWARSFVMHVDSQGMLVPISREQALEFLNYAVAAWSSPID